MTAEERQNMTETARPANGRADSRRSRAAGRSGEHAGLRIDRVFTTPGVHPYAEVGWVRRDVVETNWKTGEVVFEQREDEFPDFWSINASTIGTTKNLRGALVTPAQETGLRTLIHLVVQRSRAGAAEAG